MTSPGWSRLSWRPPVESCHREPGALRRPGRLVRHLVGASGGGELLRRRPSPRHCACSARGRAGASMSAAAADGSSSRSPTPGGRPPASIFPRISCAWPTPAPAGSPRRCFRPTRPRCHSPTASSTPSSRRSPTPTSTGWMRSSRSAPVSLWTAAGSCTPVAHPCFVGPYAHATGEGVLVPPGYWDRTLHFEAPGVRGRHPPVGRSTTRAAGRPAEPRVRGRPRHRPRRGGARRPAGHPRVPGGRSDDHRHVPLRLRHRGRLRRDLPRRHPEVVPRGPGRARHARDTRAGHRAWRPRPGGRDRVPAGRRPSGGRRPGGGVGSPGDRAQDAATDACSSDPTTAF